MMLIEGSNITIGHLGIVAGMFDKLEIGEYIDEVLPKTRHHHVSHGTAVKALTLNGLGYNESRLSLVPEFYEDIATERLLGAGVRPEHRNRIAHDEKYAHGDTAPAS
jgi:transposase